MTAHDSSLRAKQLRQGSQPRRGLRREEAAAYVGVSAAKFDDWVERQIMPRAKRQDGIMVWDMLKLDLAFDALPDDGQVVGRQSTSAWDQVDK